MRKRQTTLACFDAKTKSNITQNKLHDFNVVLGVGGPALKWKAPEFGDNKNRGKPNLVGGQWPSSTPKRWELDRCGRLRPVSAQFPPRTEFDGVC